MGGPWLKGTRGELVKEAEKKQPQREGRALQAQVWSSSTSIVQLEE